MRFFAPVVLSFFLALAAQAAPVVEDKREVVDAIAMRNAGWNKIPAFKREPEPGSKKLPDMKREPEPGSKKLPDMKREPEPGSKKLPDMKREPVKESEDAWRNLSPY
ncbi:hypothetical protein BV25DRAFT_1918579 [Artomyces pyxidatus]|uniref:Uncharacterized protein n=1 Tax=Artomyces pyxidatus TaxID=48021 RepID=A0ACB8SS63_9AGAM|nr:hypothetical protein BV25DRAFT_1918579 [Artomyces pyxidatus]